MKLSIHDKTMLIEALELAIASEGALVESYSHIDDKDADDIRKKCDTNMLFFSVLKKRMEHARKYCTGVSC